MTSPRCRACSHPLRQTLEAELQAGLSIRNAATIYGLSLGGVHRHLAHMPRAVAAGSPSASTQATDAQAPPLTDSAPSSRPGRPQARPPFRPPSTVDVADGMHLPKWMHRLQAQSAARTPDHRLPQALADAKRLEQYVLDLAAPIAGVIVTEGNHGLYSDWSAQVFYEKPGYEP
jgi:hypothetical protein